MQSLFNKRTASGRLLVSVGIYSPKASLNSLNGDSFQIGTNINRLVRIWTKVVPDMASEPCVAYIIDRGYHKTLLARELDLLLVLAVTIRP